MMSILDDTPAMRLFLVHRGPPTKQAMVREILRSLSDGKRTGTAVIDRSPAAWVSDIPVREAISGAEHLSN
jgi:hypothetical protein